MSSNTLQPSQSESVLLTPFSASGRKRRPRCEPKAQESPPPSEILQKSGLLFAYDELLVSLVERGLTRENSDIFEFAAQTFERFGRRWNAGLVSPTRFKRLNYRLSEKKRLEVAAVKIQAGVRQRQAIAVAKQKRVEQKEREKQSAALRQEKLHYEQYCAASTIQGSFRTQKRRYARRSVAEEKVNNEEVEGNSGKSNNEEADIGLQINRDEASGNNDGKKVDTSEGEGTLQDEASGNNDEKKVDTSEDEGTLQIYKGETGGDSKEKKGETTFGKKEEDSKPPAEETHAIDSDCNEGKQNDVVVDAVADLVAGPTAPLNLATSLSGSNATTVSSETPNEGVGNAADEKVAEKNDSDSAANGAAAVTNDATVLTTSPQPSAPTTESATADLVNVPSSPLTEPELVIAETLASASSAATPGPSMTLQETVANDTTTENESEGSEDEDDESGSEEEDDESGSEEEDDESGSEEEEASDEGKDASAAAGDSAAKEHGGSAATAIAPEANATVFDKEEKSGQSSEEEEESGEESSEEEESGEEESEEEEKSNSDVAAVQ